MVFTECKHFYLILVTDCDANAVTHSVVMKFPSKHLAIQLLQLHSDFIATVSVDGLEYWDLKRQKRTKLVLTPYG